MTDSNEPERALHHYTVISGGHAVRIEADEITFKYMPHLGAVSMILLRAGTRVAFFKSWDGYTKK